MRNQILSVDNSSKSRRSTGSIDIKKIITFFAIIMIIFSLGFIGVGTYAIAKNNNFAIGKSKPTLSVEQENDKLYISTTSEYGIDRIEYLINDEEKTITGNNELSLLNQIAELNLGNNKVKVTVYDINGKSQKYESEYNVEATAPQISISGSNGKIKITAKDNIKLSYVTYRWDNEDEKTIEATEDSSAQIEKEIEIPKGQHTLTVTAYNTNNLTTTKEQEVKGVKKPIVSVIQDEQDLKYLVITATDEDAVKLVEFELNGKKYKIDLSDYHESMIQYKQEMTPGENNITVTVTNFDGVKETFEGSCTYNQ